MENTPDNDKIGVDRNKIYSIYEAAPMLGRCPDTVRIWCQKGKLKAAKTGNEWQISGEAMDDYLHGGNTPRNPPQPQGTRPDFAQRKREAEEEIAAIEAEIKLAEAKGERDKPEVLGQKAEELAQKEAELNQMAEAMRQAQETLQSQARELENTRQAQELIRRSQEAESAGLARTKQLLTAGLSQLETEKGKLIADREQMAQDFSAREKKLQSSKEGLEASILAREEELRQRVSAFNDLCYRTATRVRGWGWEGWARYFERLPMNWRG